MNGDNAFEKRLQAVPHRAIPEAWRREILSAAREAAGTHSAPRETTTGVFSDLKVLLARILWPHPKAWAGLAALWLLVLGLNFAAREPVRLQLVRAITPSSPQMIEMLHQQQQLLAELVGPLDKPQVSHPKTVLPQPRSQRRQEALNV